MIKTILSFYTIYQFTSTKGLAIPAYTAPPGYVPGSAATTNPPLPTTTYSRPSTTINNRFPFPLPQTTTTTIPPRPITTNPLPAVPIFTAPPLTTTTKSPVTTAGIVPLPPLPNLPISQTVTTTKGPNINIPPTTTSPPIIFLPPLPGSPGYIPGNNPLPVPTESTLPPIDALSFPPGELYDIHGAPCTQQMGALCGGNQLLNLYAVNDNELKVSKIYITDPLPDFSLFCSGSEACKGAQIEIVIPAINVIIGDFHIKDIDCSGPKSCDNLQITVRNENFMGKVIIDNIKCGQPDSCSYASFNFVGNVDVANCFLGPSGFTTSGLSKCFEGLQSLQCNGPNECQNKVLSLTNPANGFVLECAQSGSCGGSTINIYLDTRPWVDQLTGNALSNAEPTTLLQGFKFNAEGAASLATINIDNNQRGQMLEIELVECGAQYSCAGTTFILGKHAQIKTFDCKVPGACNGCFVKEFVTEWGKPCDEYAPV